MEIKAYALVAAAAFGLWFLSKFLKQFFQLSHIPGPIYTRISDFPRALWVYQNKAHVKHIALHRKYGPIVRIAPGQYSFNTSEAARKIYTHGGKLTSELCP